MANQRQVSTQGVLECNGKYWRFVQLKKVPPRAEGQMRSSLAMRGWLGEG